MTSSHTPSQCLNYVWLGLKFADGTETANILPPEYVDNVNRIARNYSQSNMDIHLWLDHRRHSELQIAALAEQLAPNIHLRNLCEIAEYAQNDLYCREEDNPYWRDNAYSLIWQQCDAARVLVGLEQLDHYDHVYYSDMDISGFDLTHRDITWTMKNGGAISSIDTTSGFMFFENQFFGMTAGSKHVFEEIYAGALEMADKGKNGWEAYKDILPTYVRKGEPPLVWFEAITINKPAYHPTEAGKHEMAL